VLDPYLRSLEAASLEPNERVVLVADLLTKRAHTFLASGDPKSALIDAERATAMMRALSLDAYRREEQLSWSLAALSHSLRENGRVLEGITVMEEVIALDREKHGTSFQTAMRLVEQAVNFKEAEKIEEEALLLKESHWMLASLELGTEWSDRRDSRVGVTAYICHCSN
jgi:tetratricopeptide (TPR) repeat protein